MLGRDFVNGERRSERFRSVPSNHIRGPQAFGSCSRPESSKSGYHRPVEVVRFLKRRNRLNSPVMAACMSMFFLAIRP